MIIFQAVVVTSNTVAMFAKLRTETGRKKHGLLVCLHKLAYIIHYFLSLKVLRTCEGLNVFKVTTLGNTRPCQRSLTCSIRTHLITLCSE
jgi:hypothetical protein